MAYFIVVASPQQLCFFNPFESRSRAPNSSFPTKPRHKFALGNMADIPSHLAEDVDVFKTTDGVANIDAPAVDTSSALATDNLDSPIAGTASEEEKPQGPTNEDVSFLAEFLARVIGRILFDVTQPYRFLTSSEIEPKDRNGPDNDDVWREPRQERGEPGLCQENDQPSLYNNLHDLCDYDNIFEYPPMPKYAQGRSLQACLIILQMHKHGATPENKITFKLLHDIVQNVAFIFITDPPLRLLFKLSCILKHDDRFDPYTNMSSDDEDNEESDAGT
ncbi:hypothetical protein BKA65DRAFT_480112 [Rhexocercosporidium sp. MPI-PUGE-AT-0058]|nr:hypothetical protein BKA65DRAFT_480112 [Rhexocercosporidium sp. MPI-PUGE-AT-0058]